MTDSSATEQLDRRGFISAAIGASAAFSAVVMPASADTTATPVAPRLAGRCTPAT
jgi:uncharacterized membrane protein